MPDHESKSISKDFVDYDFLTTSSDMFTATEDLLLQSGPVWHGTALGWRKTATKHVTKLPVISDRFCGVKYVDSNLDSSIIAYTAYLPTSGQDDQFLEILSLLKYDIEQNNTENCIVMIGTDSNVSSKSTTRRVKAMQIFLDAFSLNSILSNTEPTFHHNNMTSESQIDHIFYIIPEKSNVKIRFKKHLCLKDDSSNLSSHDVIMGEIILPPPEVEASSKDFSSSYSDFVVKKPKWDSSGMDGYQIQTERILKGLKQNYNEVENIPILCELFSKSLVLSAQENFETTNPNYESKKKKLPQFSKDYREAHFNHKKVFEKWRKAGRPSDSAHAEKQAVLHSRRNLQRLRRNEEAVNSINLHEDLMKTFETNRNKIYEKLKKSRGDETNMKEIPFIETLVGKFEGKNVLEGFCANTEVLCNVESNDDFDNEFFKMSSHDNMRMKM